MGIGVLGDFVSSGSARKKRSLDDTESSGGTLWGLVWRPLTLAAFLILLAGLLRVQLFEGSYFRALADGNRIRKIPIHAPRGIIFDRNGVPLVVNLPSYRLKDCNTDGECRASLISKSQAIELQVKGLTVGQSLELDTTRNYPYGPAMAHILGYVSEVSAPELVNHRNYLSGDVIGRGGLEQQYEDLLRGRNGEEVVEVDALGNKLRVLGTVAPVPGKDVATNIDVNVQKTAYEQIKDQTGAVIVTDPVTGAVIALASSPSFDPNVFTDLSLPNDYRNLKINELLNDSNRPLFDRAISGTYPAGSTFKVVTATAGLESGKITQDTEITDPGILIIDQYKFPNWLYLRNGGTQGTLNVVSALQKSNDIFFYRVGEWTGVDTLAEWALKYGLTSRLGVDLPGEAAGSFPTREWRSRFTTGWYLGDTYHLAIGQGDLLTTPLQVNRWTSVMASGGKICQPKVVKGNPGCSDMGLHNKTLELIRAGLVAACSPGGTAWPLFDFSVRGKPIQIACKTGTAEFGDPKNRTHAWLTGYAPADKPEVAVSVLVEAAGEGSDVAAPMVKKILETWFTK